MFIGVKCQALKELAAAPVHQVRELTVATFEKWRREQDREHNTLVWLCCDWDRADRLLVSCGARL